MASYDAVLALQPDHRTAADNRRRLLAEPPDAKAHDADAAPALSAARLRRDLAALEEALRLQDDI
jgi:hypothetical protein